MGTEQPSTGGEIHRADPDYRRQMIVWLLVTVGAGGIMLFALVHWLGELRSQPGMDNPEQVAVWLQRLMAGLGLLLAAGSAGLAHWLYRTAESTSREKRWPPKDLQTTSDMPVRYLSSAEAKARHLRLGSRVFTVLAIAMTVWASWLMAL